MIFQKTARGGVVLMLLLVCASATRAAEEMPGVSPICQAVMNAKPDDWSQVDTTPAGKTSLIVGDGYRMDVERGGATRTYTGALIQATDRWVVLRTVSVRGQVQGVPYVMDLPLVGRLARKNVDAVQEDDVWIPREAATFRAHLKVPGRAAQSPAAQVPPVNADCFVDLVADGKIYHSHCRLTEVGEKSVNLMLYEAPGRPQRELPRDFLVSLSFVHASHAQPAAAAGGKQK